MNAALLLKNEPPGAARKVPLRDEVLPEDTWDLSLLYSTQDAWDADFAHVRRSYEKVGEFQGRLGESPEMLRDCLEFEKALDLKIERLYHYASLRVSEDSGSGESLKREGTLQNLLTRVGEAFSFVSPEIQAIDDATFQRFTTSAALKEWQIPLQRLRRLKPHTLSKNEERLMALSYSALRGHKETFSQLTNVDMQFGVIADENGEEQDLTQSSFSSFLIKRDPELRKAAFHKFYNEFDEHKYTLASAFASSVKADVFFARARNYPSALEAALFQDDVPVRVYENLISAVHTHLDPLYRYYALRRKVLKLEEIHHYDTYVPMVAEIKTDNAFDDAIELVLSSLAPLGKDYVETLGTGLRGRWVDRYENKGKRSGAFSSSSYGNPPYILMNYKRDVFSDVYTLAHEAGHSMHSWYSQNHQPFQTCSYPIFTAEVASTFNEELLTHYLLQKTDDSRMRAYLVNRQIDDIRGTVYRQTMFAEFEMLVHAMEEAGEALTLESLRRTYRGLLELYFGPDFSIDEELELECLRIPHFYNAFYVYKYATGMSAAVSLSQKVLSGGTDDLESYLGFLKSGGAKFPLPTLVAAGVDMSQPEPIANTLELFASRVKELEDLLQ